MDISDRQTSRPVCVCVCVCVFVFVSAVCLYVLFTALGLLSHYIAVSKSHLLTGIVHSPPLGRPLRHFPAYGYFSVNSVLSGTNPVTNSIHKQIMSKFF